MPQTATLAATLNNLSPLPPRAPLAAKLGRCRTLLDMLLQRVDPAHVRVAFTGGKDSTVALYLWREALARAGRGPLMALSVDTGCKFPQVAAFRDQLCADWDVALDLARPEVDLAAYPVAQDKLSCCRDLKVAPLGRALRRTAARVVISGLRRDEHPSRQDRPYAEARDATELCPEHVQLNLILDLTEMDVWAFLMREELPFCELYAEGYRSLGCMPCTRPVDEEVDAERAGRDPEKEGQLKNLRALGYF